MNPVVLTVTMNPALDKTVQVSQVKLGGLNRIGDVRMDAGGKGINVAKVLRSFGIEAEAWGIAGGRQGQVLRDCLEQAGVSFSLQEGPGETRMNMKVVDSANLLTTEFNEPGIRLDSDQLRLFKEKFSDRLDGVRYVVLGGSLPPGTPADYYGTLIEAAHRKQIPVLLDADGDAFARGADAGPFAIKPNLHEWEQYCGCTFTGDRELRESAVQVMRDKGITIVHISLGAEGSLLVHEKGAFRTRPYPIRPASTVGAGDSMVAAMVYGLVQGLPLERIARLSSAAGTVTAALPGTQVCSLAEMLRQESNVELTKL